ncbi:hypothetical protein L7F22_042115 [Adiantum nelumboides]|nr:hypothetical protein [Adiantum nelumboides]
MASSAELQFQFGQLSPALHLIETEDSWQKIDGALSKLETITKSGAYKNAAFVPLIKEHSAPIVNSLLSERTKLSGSAADLLTSVAPRLANRFEPLISTFVPPLLQLCARTNKVALIRAKKCLLLIAKHCKLASLLPLLRDAARDKSITLRNVSVEVTLMLVESIENLERLERRVGDIEIIIKSTATDRDPEVRQWSKRMFELYVERFPYRVEEFTAPLTPTTRRYLALKNTDRQAGPSTFPVKPMPRVPVEQQRPRTSPEKVIRAVSASTNKPTTHTTVKRQRDASASARSASGPQGKSTSRSVSSSSKSAQNTPSSYKETRMQEVPPPVPVMPKVDPTEERERAILKAEVARMTSATPSRGIAARLALEQFEIKVRAKSGTDGGLKAGSSSRAALTAFAVAASKKHSSPKRMPARVPLPPQPTEDRKNTKVETKNVVMPQRVVRSPIETVSIPSSPDVFGSRPMPKEAIQRNKVPIATASSKRTSTLTKNMGARGMLLGNATPSTTTKQRTKPQVKTSIPVASPRPKFFASPPLTKKQNREEELNQLGDIMEALSMTVAQEDENKENVPDVVMNTKKDNTPPLPERRNSSDSKRRSCELEPLQTINGSEDAKRMKMQSPSSIIQSRPILSPRSTRNAVRPAFHFGRMAPLVISGKKI